MSTRADAEVVRALDERQRDAADDLVRFCLNGLGVKVSES